MGISDGATPRGTPRPHNQQVSSSSPATFVHASHRARPGHGRSISCGIVSVVFVLLSSTMHLARMAMSDHWIHAVELKAAEDGNANIVIGVAARKMFHKMQRKSPAVTTTTPVRVDGIPHRPPGHVRNRWEEKEAIPSWAKDYFVWHEACLRNVTEKSWRDYRYLVMTCFATSKNQVFSAFSSCGSVSHRVRPLPAMLRIAYDTQRILLIDWDIHRDDNQTLQEWVEPPHQGGMNWTLVTFIKQAIHTTEVPQLEHILDVAKQAKDPSLLFISTMVAADDDDLYGESYYNSKMLPFREARADRVFHDIFNVLFKPNYILQERIMETHHTLGLSPGGYATVHISDNWNDHKKIQPASTSNAAQREALRIKVENAMNCVSNLRPGGPFLVTAPTHDICKLAVQYAKKKGVTVTVAARRVAAEDESALLPNKDDVLLQSWLDFYLMANTRCVAHGQQAGYGQLGYIVGHDYNCRIKYEGDGGRHNCQWTDSLKQ